MMSDVKSYVHSRLTHLRNPLTQDFNANEHAIKDLKI